MVYKTRLGASMVWSTGVLIMAPMVPENVDTVTSWTESCIGLGIAFGPPIGSFFFAWGGFSGKKCFLPF